MLSFLTDTCEQLAEGAAHEACEWAASNPAIALGLSAGTLLATAASGLYFYNRKPATKTSVSNVPVARLARQALTQTISNVSVDQRNLVVPTVAPELSTEQKMNVNLLVLGELNRQLQDPATAEVARQLLVLRQTKRKEIDSLILKSLGLTEDGKKPNTKLR